MIKNQHIRCTLVSVPSHLTIAFPLLTFVPESFPLDVCCLLSCLPCVFVWVWVWVGLAPRQKKRDYQTEALRVWSVAGTIAGGSTASLNPKVLPFSAEPLFWPFFPPRCGS